MLKFPSIEGFHNVVRTVRKRNDYLTYQGRTDELIRQVSYIGTVKLHGSNASVSVNSVTGEIKAFSRERELSVDSDNYGFAIWVEKNKDAILKLHADITPEEIQRDAVVTYFGEWIGQGIQKGVAVSELPKHFVCFMAHVTVPGDEVGLWYVPGVYDTTVFRWIAEVPIYRIVIDFENPEKIIEDLTTITENVETKCPWGALHNVEGVGEGVVWAPEHTVHRVDNSLWFKTKGLKHKVAGGKDNKITVDPAVVEGINALVEEILPEWRLEQGVSYLRENNLEVSPENTGEYIKWISKDVLKECVDVIAANNVEWKAVAGPISKKAREYYFKLIRESL
jgi:hypothetical protein